MKRSISELTGSSNGPDPKKIKQWSVYDYLVEDTLKLILSKIDLKCQRRARLVCKQWFNIINLSEFNIGFIQPDELDSVVKVLRRYNQPISVSFNNLDSVNSEHLLKLSQLTNLVSFRGNIGQQNTEIFSALTGLQSIMTDQISTDIFPVLTKLTKLSCTNLNGYLTASVTQLKDFEVGQYCTVSMDKFPNLTSLNYMKKFQMSLFSGWQLTGLESLIVADYSSNRTFPITLTRLDIHEYNFSQSFADSTSFYNTMTTLTRMKHLGIPGSLQQQLISSYPLLEKCDVGSVYHISSAKVWTTLGQLSHLTSLKVHLEFVPPEEYILALTKLRELNIRGTLTPNEVDMSIFSSLVNLTKLQFSNSGFKMDVKIYNFMKLTSLTALQHLEVFHGIHQEQFFSNLTNLTFLHLTNSPHVKINQKFCFTMLTKLLELNMRCPNNTQLNDIVDNLDSMTHLTTLRSYS